MKTFGLAVAVIVVSACAVAVADQITLKTGDVLIGEVTERSDDHVRLEHPVLGSLAIPAEQVASVAVDATGQAPVVESPAGQVEAAQVGDKAESSAKPQAARTPKRRLLFAGWDASLEIGINGSQGNSETLNARVAFNAAKEDDLHRWKIAASYHTATSGGDATRNESMAGLTKDWLLPGSLWFYFAAGRIDIDEFESWDFRLSGTGGIGLELVNRGDLEARVRAVVVRSSGAMLTTKSNPKPASAANWSGRSTTVSNFPSAARFTPNSPSSANCASPWPLTGSSKSIRPTTSASRLGSRTSTSPARKVTRNTTT